MGRVVPRVACADLRRFQPLAFWLGTELRIDDRGVLFGSGRVRRTPAQITYAARNHYLAPWPAIRSARLVRAPAAVRSMAREARPGWAGAHGYLADAPSGSGARAGEGLVKAGFKRVPESPAASEHFEQGGLSLWLEDTTGKSAFARHVLGLRATTACRHYDTESAAKLKSDYVWGYGKPLPGAR